MAKKKPATSKKQKGIPSLLGATSAAFLASTTTEWRRIIAKNASQAVVDSISDLSARGLLEVRIVAAVEMSGKKMPKCRYVGGGEWWTLLEKELDRLVPSEWIGSDGKPKKNLLKCANVVAIRLTADGHDYVHSLHKATSCEIETYLRCDGIDSRTKKTSPPVFDRDRGVLTFSGNSNKVSTSAKYTLCALIENTPTTLATLRQSTDDRPDRVLKALIKQFPFLNDFIVIPGGKGRGGYSTTITFGVSQSATK